jgi:hypothetical protein
MHEHIARHESGIEGSSDRSFGLVFAAIFLIVATLPLLHGHGVRLWAAGACLIFGAIAVVWPAVLAPLNRLWTRFGLLLHRIVSPIALGVLFYGVVTPTGFLVRVFGKDILHLRVDKSARSYWVKRDPGSAAPENFKLPF